MKKVTLLVLIAIAALTMLAGCGGLGSTPSNATTPTPGGGTSSPTPAAAPTATFTVDPTTVAAGQPVTLTWSTQNATQVTISGIGAVAASGTRQETPTADTTYTLTATGPGGGPVNVQATVTVKALATFENSVNHIIMMYQENRGFDHYFGKLNKFRAKLIQQRPDLAIPACDVAGVATDPSKSLSSPNCVDGLPDDDATAKTSPCDGFAYCNVARADGPVTPFAMNNKCSSNLSPSWNESHRSYNLSRPSSEIAKNDGFVTVAGGFANSEGDADVLGLRAIGYYDERAFPYYYFLATTFATSDRWFCPVPARTQPNRIAQLAATTRGHAHDPARHPEVPLPKVTIFDLLQRAGVSWRVYTTSGYSAANQRPGVTFLNFFPIAAQHFENFAPISQYFTDLQNGTLPSVVLIESGYATGQDEHPQNHIQVGAQFVKTFIDALMQSQYWKDSVFILSYDEGGGFYDHVPAMKAVHPDGIPPQDLEPGDVPGDFTRTGFRVPLIVISPFTKKGYVSHTPADITATNKFIATRFLKDPTTGVVPNLTERDKAQFDMTEFFDFQNPPWLTPPTGIPEQLVGGPCNQVSVP